MTKRLQQAIDKARLLPARRQDEIAEIVAQMADQGGDDPLTADQWAEVRRRRKLPRRYASDAEVKAVFRNRRG